MTAVIYRHIQHSVNGRGARDSRSSPASPSPEVEVERYMEEVRKLVGTVQVRTVAALLVLQSGYLPGASLPRLQER